MSTNLPLERITVYPRVCGGTISAKTSRSYHRGLSPRVRGNRDFDPEYVEMVRSIPACAGEPFATAPTTTTPTVYPRVCGGTASELIGGIESKGLSPRVRGNPIDTDEGGETVGSIPACAGEPRAKSPAGIKRAVYPRVCGGTEMQPRLKGYATGLSPRVRGNRQCSHSASHNRGSIPACAGEPGDCWQVSCERRVYPRVCGGTCEKPRAKSPAGGLSPRVRGNHRRRGRAPDLSGSIPACAGEPSPSRPSSPFQTVYPRVCGGTIPAAMIIESIDGLSPRVRGNQRLPRPQLLSDRSIPACAGEPRQRVIRRLRHAVYPRVCGGTENP